jgi:hypothetical protein
LLTVADERGDDVDDGGYWWWQSKAGKSEKWEVLAVPGCGSSRHRRVVYTSVRF